jgi:hypothetical protein
MIYTEKTVHGAKHSNAVNTSSGTKSVETILYNYSVDDICAGIYQMMLEGIHYDPFYPHAHAHAQTQFNDRRAAV